jgi:hypothetical protein
MSYFCSENYNNILKRNNQEEIFTYLIAGGDKSLVKSQEYAEDSIKEGLKDIKEKINNEEEEYIYIGITCGFSAAYVLSQVEYCKTQKNVCTILIGFNNVEQISDIENEEMKKSFQKIVKELKEDEENKNYFLINPIIGPEGKKSILILRNYRIIKNERRNNNKNFIRYFF